MKHSTGQRVDKGMDKILKQTHFQLAFGKISLLVHKRSTFLALSLIIILTAAALAISLLGAYPLTLHRLLETLFGGETLDRLVLFDIRLPRILVAVCTGGLLALSGAIFQALLRNPLASPDLLGFNIGAATGALATLLIFSSTQFVVPGAVLGGLATALFVILLAWNRGIDLFHLIMVGIGIGFTLLAVSNYLMTQMDVQRASDMAKWLVGSFSQASTTDALLSTSGLLILGSFALGLQFALDRMVFSDDTAISLGLDIHMIRMALVLCAILMSAVAVAVAGPLPFIAFVSGPIARQMAKTSSSALPLAMLIGMLLTLLADTVARSLIGAYQLPTGIFTALIGAPYLIWLLAKQAKRDII